MMFYITTEIRKKLVKVQSLVNVFIAAYFLNLTIPELEKFFSRVRCNWLQIILDVTKGRVSPCHLSTLFKV